MFSGDGASSIVRKLLAALLALVNATLVDVQLVAGIARQLVFAGVVLALSVLKGGELGLALI
jgi:hypothetical protein